jgi:uncharacterized protein (DUF169 family)
MILMPDVSHGEVTMSQFEDRESAQRGRTVSHGHSTWNDADAAELSDALRTCLLLGASPVGVSVIRTHEEFESYPFPKPQVAVHYCSAVKMATEGTSLKLGPEDISCDTSPRTLGLEAGFLDEDFVASYVAAGLYESVERAREILEDVTTLDSVCGVAVGPLEAFTNIIPDVVIVPASPYAAMRLTQAASYTGNPVRNRIIGMHGMCSECTAAPMATGQVCTSLMCSGARYLADWSDDLVSVGVPFDLLPRIVATLVRTAEQYETDERKGEMQRSCGCSLMPRRFDDDVAELSEGGGYFYTTSGE